MFVIKGEAIVVPREASVYFLMGKICKQLGKWFHVRVFEMISGAIGRRDEAMMHFTSALDLDPKDSTMIKQSIDKLDSTDMDEDDEL